MLLKRSLIIVAVSGSLLTVGQANARQTVLTGSLDLSHSYDSNVFNTDGGHIDEWNSVVSPDLSLATLGEADKVEISYTPEFSYNYRRDTDEMVHNLALDAERSLSSKWQVTMSDAYTYSDNPVFEADANLTIEQQFQRADDFTQAEVVRLLFPEIIWGSDKLSYVLSQIFRRYDEASSVVQRQVDDLLTPAGGNNGRQRYFSNDLTLGSVYQFAEDSALSFNYAINILDNKTGTQADSVEQNPSISLAYRFNPRWRLEVAYSYSVVDYDSSDDSTTNNPSLNLDYTYDVNNKINATYDYENIAYDGATGDSTNQSLGFGWDRALTQVSNLKTSIDFSYNKRELGADEREVDVSLGWDRKYDRGTISLNGDGVWAEGNGNGSWDDLHKSWGVDGDVSYDLMEDLSSSLRGSYEKRYAWNANIKDTYDDFDLGATLTYKFARWFSLSLDYDYKLFNTDSASVDDYNEHIIMLKLSAAKELWRR